MSFQGRANMGRRLRKLLVFLAFTVPGAATADPEPVDVRYVFWSPFKYAVGDEPHRFVMNGFAPFGFDAGFESLFEDGTEARRLVQRAETKYRIANWVLGVAGTGLVVYGALEEDDRALTLGGGAALLLGDIYLGWSATRDVQRAAELRNATLRPMVGLRF